MKKRYPKIQNILLIFVSIIAGILLSELIIRFFFPQEYIFPAYLADAEYGVILPAGSTQIHAKGRKWKYDYRINNEGFRGDDFTQHIKDSQIVVVALGDSYTFGQCVEENDIYTFLLNKQLEKKGISVINLGVPGWSLGQEVKAFYQKVLKYKPSIVLLQFCANDPAELCGYPVAYSENGQIKFRALSVIRKTPSICWLTGIVKKSQWYNLVRNAWHLKKKEKIPKGGNTFDLKAQQYYLNLLNVFAFDLKSRNITLVFFSVNKQLDAFPFIKGGVISMQQSGMISYLDTEQWFQIDNSFLAPDGHLWNAKAHTKIAAKLAENIKIIPNGR